MDTLKRSGSVLAFIGLVGVAALAQQPPSPRESEQAERAKNPAPVSGDLISLEPEAKTLLIKIDSGNEMKFSYTVATEIVGAEKGVAGLATTSGTRLTVHYSVHGTANTATKIEVVSKQSLLARRQPLARLHRQGHTIEAGMIGRLSS